VSAHSQAEPRGILAPRRVWTEDEVASLRSLYPHYKTVDVATMIGRPLGQTYQKANGLGLRKTDEYLASPAACRLRRGDNVGAAHRFKPGQIVWNKGMKGLQIGGEETQFKPGQMPHNTVPVGSHRITKDGTLQRKISSDKGNSSKRWRGVHELIWVEANGPVPRGHIVVFKPGQRSTELSEITIDRVECITLADNMRRNTVHNYPPEIAKLAILRGALNRQINKRSPA
jgi:hypothetical protein